MSLRLAIPRRVALQQRSPPLHQPGVILKQKEQCEKENPSNGKCASSRLSQQRGSPHQPVFCSDPTKIKTTQAEESVWQHKIVCGSRLQPLTCWISSYHTDSEA